MNNNPVNLESVRTSNLNGEVLDAPQVSSYCNGRLYKIQDRLPLAFTAVRHTASKAFQTLTRTLTKTCLFLHHLMVCKQNSCLISKPYKKLGVDFRKCAEAEADKILRSNAGNGTQVPKTDEEWADYFQKEASTAQTNYDGLEKLIEENESDAELDEWWYYGMANQLENFSRRTRFCESALAYFKKESESFKALREHYERTDSFDTLSDADRLKLLTYYENKYKDLQKEMSDPRRPIITGGCGTADQYWKSFYEEKIGKLKLEPFNELRDRFEKTDSLDTLSDSDRLKLLAYYENKYKDLLKEMSDPRRPIITGGCGTADQYWKSFYEEKIKKLKA